MAQRTERLTARRKVQLLTRLIDGDATLLATVREHATRPDPEPPLDRDATRTAAVPDSARHGS